jgi:hypothetical protein
MINRTVFSDDGTLSDVSVKLNKFDGGTFVMPFVAGEDYLYVASDFPFNHRYVELQTVNDEVSSVSVDVWDGSYWIPCEDIIDQTAVGGVSLAQSGHISFRPNDDKGWSRESTNDESDQITGLTGIKIFDMYWARFSWSNDLAVETELKHIGHKFSNDSDISLIYPVLMNPTVLDQFQDLKTSWDLQHFHAAEQIIRDMKRKNIIFSRNQILDWQTLNEASVHKVAEIAFRAFGKDFEQERKDANDQYEKALKLLRFHIDENNNAILDRRERTSKVGFFRR